jgi:hypothetical protein
MARAKSQRHSQKRSHHKSRRVVGGAWYNPMSWFEKEEEPSLFGPVEEKPLLQSVGEGAQDLMQKADQKIVEASNAISSGVSSASQSVENTLNTDIPLTSEPAPEPTYFQPSAPASSFGGKRRRYKGGKGGLGLTYYASPVDGMKVAEPTYWEEYKGGAKRSRRRSRSRTQKKSRGRSRGRGRGRARAKSQRRARR